MFKDEEYYIFKDEKHYIFILYLLGKSDMFRLEIIEYW